MIILNKLFLEKLKNKDEESWKKIYLEYKSMVIKLVERNSGDRSEAEDLFQNVTMSLMKNIQKEKVRIDTELKNYIYTLAINQWRSKLKNGKKSTLIVIDDNLILDDLLEEDSAIAEYDDKLDAIYAQIKDKCRQLFELKYSFQKRSMEEIAQLCGFGNARSATSQLNKCMNSAKKIALAL